MIKFAKRLITSAVTAVSVVGGFSASAVSTSDVCLEEVTISFDNLVDLMDLQTYYRGTYVDTSDPKHCSCFSFILVTIVFLFDIFIPHLYQKINIKMRIFGKITITMTLIIGEYHFICKAINSVVGASKTN